MIYMLKRRACPVVTGGQTMTPKEATIRLREWYRAFKNCGKGDEPTVQELLEAADLIDSLAADLDTLRQFTKELSARNEELRKENTTLKLKGRNNP